MTADDATPYGNGNEETQDFGHILYILQLNLIADITTIYFREV
jgi:hypothetical protein